MIELQAPEFYKARPLFEPLMAYQMFCAGVLDGLYTGRVFVDDRDNPQSGYVSKEGSWWFLAGNPHNLAFNQALNTALFNRTINGEKNWGGMLVCHPADWDAQIPVIFAPHIPITTKRLHYTCRKLQVDWRSQIPEGFDVRFVDNTLIRDGIEVHGAAEDVLKLRQESPQPDQKAVGFVAIRAGKIVASSVIDCIVNKGGDIGLYTDYEHRRRNLAYLTAAAVMEYALAHGVDVVHWDCESYNIGSIRTAEKLGLEFSHAHTMYTLILNPVRHELNRAWAFIDSGHFDQAFAICEERINNGQTPVHAEFFYISARCHLAVGKDEDAVRALELAVKAGWDSLDEMQGDFARLAQHPLWHALVDQTQKNAS